MTRPPSAPRDPGAIRYVAPDLTEMLRQALGGFLPPDAGLSQWLDRMERPQ